MPNVTRIGKNYFEVNEIIGQLPKRHGIEEWHLAEACLVLGEELCAVGLLVSPLLRKAFTYKKRTKEKIGSEL